MVAHAKAKKLDILIEELDGSVWVAALSNGRLDGLEVDPVAEEVRWGSIYWAKVARIDKALDAAFVNLDGDNIGLLHNADVRIKQKDGSYKKGGDVEIGKLIQPGQMIAVQAKSGYLPLGDPREKKNTTEYQEDKNPRVSMNISLPGRYLIHTPLETENRLSRRIRHKDMRARMQGMLDDLKECKGCILRAAATNTQTDVLVREAKILQEIWNQLSAFFEGDNPSLIMLGPDAVQRTLGDHAFDYIERIEITTMDHYQDTEEWCEIYAPDLVTRINPIELPDQNAELGLFSYRDIVGQIEDVFQPYVVMDSGAVLILQETAALMAVDVNRGADKRSNFEINMDAAEEIARQMRLRNLGGVFMVDFLKMKTAEQKKLTAALEEFCMRDDPCTVQISGMTKLGFMEISRHRRTPPLQDRFDNAAGN